MLEEMWSNADTLASTTSRAVNCTGDRDIQGMHDLLDGQKHFGVAKLSTDSKLAVTQSNEVGTIAVRPQ